MSFVHPCGRSDYRGFTVLMALAGKDKSGQLRKDLANLALRIYDLRGEDEDWVEFVLNDREYLQIGARIFPFIGDIVDHVNQVIPIFERSLKDKSYREGAFKEPISDECLEAAISSFKEKFCEARNAGEFYRFALENIFRDGVSADWDPYSRPIEERMTREYIKSFSK